MIYIFDKRLWAEGKENVIRTEIGEVALRIEDKSSMTKTKILIYDRFHVEIGRIESRRFKKNSLVSIYYDNSEIATFHAKRFFFSKGHHIKTSDKVTFSIRGRIHQFKYDILNGRKVAARVSPELAHRPHQYGMESTDDKKHRYAFLCTAVILSQL